MLAETQSNGRNRIDSRSRKNMINVQIKDFGMDALHIAALSGFAVAQPLYDVLSRNPEFFTAHQSRPLDIIALAIILSGIFPLLGIAIECIAWLFSGQVRKRVHVALAACLFILIVSPVLNRVSGIPTALTAIGAVALGITAAFLYYRFSPVRLFVTVLSPAIVVFPALFLLYSPVSKIVLAQQDVPIALHRIDSTAPVIMIVFDELPVSSLMDKHRQIDQVRYPHFASLGRDAYWFRNYSTNGERTEIALTTILTGSYPDHNRVPTYAQYPRNLFALLGGSYNMHVLEPDTMLCPDELCRSGKDRLRFLHRIRSLVLDSSVVYLHILLPRDVTAGLPPVTITLKDFWTDTPLHADQARFNYFNRTKKQTWQEKRADVFAAFIDSIETYDGPGLHFLHSELPHAPWEYFPSGREYASDRWAIPGLDMQSDMWDADERLVIQGYQRHLLQVGFVDTLLGNLIAKLREQDMYERSLIIVTADHGINFQPGKNRRNITEEHPGNVMLVPLFIKAPHQHEGVISDHVVESVDILPTIADILDIQLPWNVDGYSAVDNSFPERQERTVYNHLYEKIKIGSNRDMLEQDLKRKLALFGDASQHDSLFTSGRHGSLMGLDVADTGAQDQSASSAVLDRGHLFQDVDPDTSFIPAHITGRMVPGLESDDQLSLAVAINGRIAGISQTYLNKDKETLFSFIVPETVYEKGMNEIEIFVIEEKQGDPVRLLSTKGRSPAEYDLAGDTLGSSEGIIARIRPHAIQNALDRAEISKGRITFYGWAADIEKSRIPDEIVIFVNRAFFFAGRTNLKRPDVVTHFDNSTLLYSGFRYEFPLSRFKDIKNAHIQLFAVSKDGVASELHYPEGYQWGSAQ
jgi:hypothetical protein